MEPTVAVYEVKMTFEHDGLTYQAGEKYQLPVDLAMSLPEGTLVPFYIAPVEDAATPAEEAAAPVVEEQPAPVAEAPAAPQPATPWVGGHTVGRS